VRFFQIQLRYSQAPGWGPGRGTKATVEHYPDIMQKLFDAAVDYPLVLIPANEEFPRNRAVDNESLDHSAGTGWNAFEIWRRHIRPAPGTISLFLPRR
jgi:hypothetical protein